MKILFHLHRGVALMAGAMMVVSGASGQDTAAPSLVVMMVVDQLRGDMIDHYEAAFSGGFRRLLDEGYQFTNASHAHARTHAAAGHATLSTGVFPSRSGIVANEWFLRTGETWQIVYAVEDLDSPILGFESERTLPGRSPNNLLRTGLADWVRAADDGARTVSISSKDRAAIPLAGKTDSNVYWLLPRTASFITSTHYAARYPGWLNRFNKRVMPTIVGDLVWENGVPERFRFLARSDSASYEGANAGRGGSTFPHRSSGEAVTAGLQAHYQWALRHAPADAAVIALAQAAIEEFELGQRDQVDYLAISLSATDYVGHDHGPFSQEQLVNLTHVDRVLGEFLEYLDEEVGDGAWLMGLSSDHGVVTMPEYERERGDRRVVRIRRGDETQRLSAALRAASDRGGSPEEIAERLASSLEAEGTVAKAYTQLELTRAEPADSFAVLFQNSHYPGRALDPLSSYGVEIRYREGDLVHFRTGTTHGTPYWYDRHVPFILLGAGIEAGSSDASAYTVDMAPTLAALAGIEAPYDLDGRVIYTR